MPRPDDVLAALDARVLVVLEPEPGWVWGRCPTCGELRYQRRARDLGRCLMTPGCKGRMAIYLEALCSACGKPVTARRRALNVEFCSNKCEKGAAA